MAVPPSSSSKGGPFPTDSRTLSFMSLRPHPQAPVHRLPRPYPLTSQAFVPCALCTMAGAPRAPNSCCGARMAGWGLSPAHPVLKGSAKLTRALHMLGLTSPTSP